MQIVDLNKAERVAPPAPGPEQKQTSPQLSKPFYASSDEDDEEHMLGCACCPGGRNVVFRVY